MSEFESLPSLWNLNLFGVVIVDSIIMFRVYFSNKYSGVLGYQKQKKS